LSLGVGTESNVGTNNIGRKLVDSADSSCRFSAENNREIEAITIHFE